MANVTNKHDAPLNVAGIDVRPGATVEINDTKLVQWKNGHAAKVWTEQGLIVIDGEEAPAPKDPEPKNPADSNGDGKVSDRERMMARAKELGLNPNATTSNKKLEEMIVEAEAK